MSERIIERIFWIGILFLVGIMGYAVISQNANLPSVSMVSASDTAVKGSQEENSVVVVEYSDFQCPACKLMSGVIRSAVQQSDNVTFVYRHFPLTSIHPNAIAAAQAAEAAGKQGKFWEMHDYLFMFQSDWADLSSDVLEAEFVSYAKDIGLEEAQFLSDMKSSEVRAKVSLDARSASSLGLNSTPTFFVNGEKLDAPPRTAEEFVKIFTQYDK